MHLLTFFALWRQACCARFWGRGFDLTLYCRHACPYTKEDGGFRVVTTMAAGEGGLPFRFVTTLTEGQQFVISIPRKVGEFTRLLEIASAERKLAVTGAEATPETALAN
jgi:hypothetical protein